MTEGFRDDRGRGTPEDVTIHDPDDVIGGVAAGGGGGGGGERATGTPNTIYDLSSVLFHALEGGASYDTYIEDAEREGDQELADFFIQVRDEDAMRADEAQRLLAERTTSTARGGATDTAPGVAATEGVEPDLPLSTEPRAEGVTSGDPRREHAITEMPNEDLTPPEEAVPPDAPRPPEAAPRAEAVEPPPRTEPIGARPGLGDVPSGRIEETPPARVEDEPMAEDVPSGTPPQAPPGDVQRAGSTEPRVGETARGEGEGRGEREEDKSLIDKAIDKLTGEEEQRRDR
jgi:hypothetical protein